MLTLFGTNNFSTYPDWEKKEEFPKHIRDHWGSCRTEQTHIRFTELHGNKVWDFSTNFKLLAFCQLTFWDFIDVF